MCNGDDGVNGRKRYVWMGCEMKEVREVRKEKQLNRQITRIKSKKPVRK